MSQAAQPARGDQASARGSLPSILTVELAQEWLTLAAAALAAREAAINELNVFPVPDSDTGTNMRFTLEAALRQLDTELGGTGEDAEMREWWQALTRALLINSRGNSGVLLSQILAGLGLGVTRSRRRARPRRRGAINGDAQSLVDGFVDASRAAADAVANPVQGTMITVAAAVAAAAKNAYSAPTTRALGADWGDHALPIITKAAAHAAVNAVGHTTAQLKVLADHNVVDAGGLGLAIVVEALDRVVQGDHRGPHTPLAEQSGGQGSQAQAQASEHSSANFESDMYLGAHPLRGGANALQGVDSTSSASSGSYEVQYLWEAADEAAATSLRNYLVTIGDSVLVVGDGSARRVHVHTDAIGPAIEAALTSGRVRDIAVSDLTAGPAGAEGAHAHTPRVNRAVLACVAGPGLAELAADLGASTVLSTVHHRATVPALVHAARATHARMVLVVPNDATSAAAANQARAQLATEDIGVRIIPAHTSVQVVAALAVADTDLPLEEVVLEMTRAAAGTRHGGVTMATKETQASSGLAQLGDALAVVNGRITSHSPDAARQALEVLATLAAGGGDLVTLVHGEQPIEGAEESLRAWLGEHLPAAQIEVIHGGQAAYPLLIGVA